MASAAYLPKQDPPSCALRPGRAPRMGIEACHAPTIDLRTAAPVLHRQDFRFLSCDESCCSQHIARLALTAQPVKVLDVHGSAVLRGEPHQLLCSLRIFSKRLRFRAFRNDIRPNSHHKTEHRIVKQRYLRCCMRSECLLLTAGLKPAPPSAQDRFAASNAGGVSEPLENAMEIRMFVDCDCTTYGWTLKSILDYRSALAKEEHWISHAA